MTWDDYRKSLLAITIWREARGEPYQVKLAVAYSILNRVKRPSWWGHSIDEVIGKKWQYSSMAAPGDPNLIKWPTYPDAAFDDCMKAVDVSITITDANPVPGADSYYDISIPPPKWATPETFVKQIGKIRFYNTDSDHEKEVTND